MSFLLLAEGVCPTSVAAAAVAQVCGGHAGLFFVLGHLGDSRALLCSWTESADLPAAGAIGDQITPKMAQADAQRVCGDSCVTAAVLTSDHSPGRPDEIARIAAAGGNIVHSTSGNAPSPSLPPDSAAHA